jgi:hypothetical protein
VASVGILQTAALRQQVSAVAKARKPRIPPQLEDLAERMASAYYRMVARVRSQIDVDTLANLLSQGADRALAYLDLQKRLMDAAQGVGQPVREYSFWELWDQAFEAGAKAALLELDRVPIRKARQTVGAQLAFDLRNPRAIAFLRTYRFELIREISRESVEAIRNILLRAFQEGGHPWEQARLIRNVVGLTQRQANAIANYYRTLTGMGSQLRPALERALRDRRFDRSIMRAIEEGGFLDPDQIDRMTQRYYDRMLTYRAETVARTETIRANSEGRHETWRQAVEQGLIDPQTTKRVWIPALGERTCPVCAAVPDMNPDGVGLDEPFDTEEGPIMNPPLHPRCRCVVALRFLGGGEQVVEYKSAE